MAAENKFLNPITDRWIFLGKSLHTKLVKFNIVDKLGEPIPGWESRVEAFKAASAPKGAGAGQDTEIVITKPLHGAAKLAHEAKAARLAAEQEDSSSGQAKPAKGGKAAAKAAQGKKAPAAAKGKVKQEKDAMEEFLNAAIAQVERESGVARRPAAKGRSRAPVAPVQVSEDEEDYEDCEDDSELVAEDDGAEQEAAGSEEDEFPTTDEDEEDRTVVV